MIYHDQTKSTKIIFYNLHPGHPRPEDHRWGTSKKARSFSQPVPGLEMSGRTLLPAVDPLACCLVTKPSDALSDSATLTLKNRENPKHRHNVQNGAADTGIVAVAAAAAAAASATTVFAAAATDEFDCFSWSGSEGRESAEEEETRVLNDLLRLGLEFGDLESVFGTHTHPQLEGTSSSGGCWSSVHHAAETRGVAESEEEVVRCVDDGRYADGDDNEDLFLLDADLEGA